MTFVTNQSEIFYRKRKVMEMEKLKKKSYPNWLHSATVFHTLKTSMRKRKREKRSHEVLMRTVLKLIPLEENVKPKVWSINSKKWKRERQMENQKVSFNGTNPLPKFRLSKIIQ